ncbi:MAG: hypothetical protein HY926_00135 [Elusimicrobia bacterium]|nr:hypothetical protein [Elusimicrobiota bacterium]
MYRQADVLFGGLVGWGLALVAALLCGTVGCAGAPRRGPAERAVAAEGWAPADARDLEGARRRALADAQRRAVEQVSGVFLAALTRVEDSAALRQKITAEVRGRVSRYEVLSESRQDGLLKVRIRAWVVDEPAPRPPGPPAQEARVTLAASGGGLYDEDLGGSAAGGIRRELLAGGFDVAPSGPSPQTLALRAEARAVPVPDRRLGAFHSARARVSLAAVDPGSGAVVWETAQEASALDLDPGLASVRAAEAAGILAGRRAAVELSEALWKRF